MRRAGFHSRLVFAVAALGALLTFGAGLRSAEEDKWWPDYAGGPASARYFDAREINRGNVDKLAVAWAYPYGETGLNPIVAHGVVYGRGRNGSLIALDARTGKELWIREGMQGMTDARHELLGEQGRQGPPADLQHERLPAGDRRGHRAADLRRSATTAWSISREGLGRDPATIGRIQSGTPGAGLREPDPARIRHR